MITKIMMSNFGVQKIQPKFMGKKREDGVQKVSAEQNISPEEILAGSEILEAQKANASVKRMRKKLVPGDAVTESYMKAAEDRMKLNKAYEALLENLRTRQEEAETKLDTMLKTAFSMQKEAEQKISKTMEIYKAAKSGHKLTIDGVCTVLAPMEEGEAFEEYDTDDNLLRRSVIKDGSLQNMEEFSNGKMVAQISVTYNGKETSYSYKTGNKAVEFGESYKGEPYHIKFESFKRNGSIKTTLEKTHILSLSCSELKYKETSGKTRDWTEITSKGGALCSIKTGKTVGDKDVTLESTLFGDAYGNRYPISYNKFNISEDGIETGFSGVPLVSYRSIPYTGPTLYFETSRDENGNIIKKEITPGFDGVYTEYVNDVAVKAQTSRSYRENGRLLYKLG